MYCLPDKHVKLSTRLCDTALVHIGLGPEWIAPAGVRFCGENFSPLRSVHAYKLGVRLCRPTHSLLHSYTYTLLSTLRTRTQLSRSSNRSVFLMLTRRTIRKISSRRLPMIIRPYTPNTAPVIHSISHYLSLTAVP